VFLISSAAEEEGVLLSDEVAEVEEVEDFAEVISKMIES
jgi:hypothetical protein